MPLHSCSSELLNALDWAGLHQLESITPVRGYYTTSELVQYPDKWCNTIEQQVDMRAILQVPQNRLGLPPISPRSSTRCVPRMDAVSAGQQLHPRALHGHGDVEGTGLHANMHGVREADSVAVHLAHLGLLGRDGGALRLTERDLAGRDG